MHTRLRRHRSVRLPRLAQKAKQIFDEPIALDCSEHPKYERHCDGKSANAPWNCVEGKTAKTDPPRPEERRQYEQGSEERAAPKAHDAVGRRCGLGGVLISRLAHPVLGLVLLLDALWLPKGYAQHVTERIRT